MADLRDFEYNLPMALLRARENIMARFRPILRDHNITEQQWRVIRALNSSDEALAAGLEPTLLAEKTLLHMPSLTRILKSLEEQKLITLNTVENDNRRKTITLSKRGQDLFNQISPLSEAEYEQMEKHIGTDALTELYTLLEKISR